LGGAEPFARTRNAQRHQRVVSGDVEIQAVILAQSCSRLKKGSAGKPEEAKATMKNISVVELSVRRSENPGALRWVRGSQASSEDAARKS
jgi:hypothetical protein